MEKKACKRVNKKRRQGPGESMDLEAEDLYEKIDIVVDRLGEMLYFSESEEEDDEE